MQVKDTLKIQLDANHMLVNKNLSGITHQESLTFPQEVSNPMNWILGHLIFSRNLLLQIFGEKPLWENFKVYDRGFNAKDTKDGFLDFEELKSLFNESQNRLMPLLEKFDNLTEKGQEDATFLVLHEIYHCGQLGYMRRLLGKEGVIK
jgi:uncharacterized damage-inducible protein DinB